MKKLLFAVVFSAVGFISQAQTSFGGKAGANFTTFSGKDADGSKIKVGFNAGLLANISVSENFSVQPEALFSIEGAKDESGASTNLGYVRIPVMLKYNTSSGFFVEAGPQIGLLISAKAKSGDLSFDFKDQVKSTDFGAAFGLGYKLESGLGFGARYNVGLTSISKEAEANVKNSGFSIGLTYMFGGK